VNEIISEVSLYVMGIMLVLIGLIGGIIWAMPGYLLNRTETELDDLGNRYYSLVVIGYLTRFISSRIQHNESDRREMSIRISQDEIGRIENIFIRRTNYGITREEMRNAKKSVFKYYFAFLVIFLVTVVIYFFSSSSSDLVEIGAIFSLFLFVSLLSSIWNYRNELTELEEEIVEINNDLRTEAP
jgi:hypothetical protein